MKTVSEYYNITDHEIYLLARSEGGYWETVRTFWDSVSQKKMMFLSEKQARWLDRIEDDLDNKWRPRWLELEAEQYDIGEIPF